MRVLFVSHRFPPRFTAGTEAYAYNLSMRMKARHELQVFYTDKRVSLPQYQVLEEETTGIPTRVMINNLCYDHFGETFSNPRAERAFGRVLDQFQPDLVHIHHLMYSSLKIPGLVAAQGIPVVMTLHDFYLACPRGGRLMLPDGALCPGPEPGRCGDCLSAFKYRQSGSERRMISVLAGLRTLFRADLTPLAYCLRDKVFKKDLGQGILGPFQGDPVHEISPFLAERKEVVRSLFSAVDYFMTPSQTVGDGLVEAGLPREKLHLWKYGIDLEPFEQTDRPVRRRPPVVGYFGTLMPHKGVHVLVEAAASLAPGKVKVVIRGSQDENPDYVRSLKAAARGADIEFKPGFSRAEVGRAFSQVDLLVVPSLWLENSPVVIQEAFAAACPVITSDKGGMGELVTHDKNGALFPMGDARALAGLLQEVGDHPHRIDTWRKGIDLPRSIEDDVTALEALYARLTAK